MPDQSVNANLHQRRRVLEPKIRTPGDVAPWAANPENQAECLNRQRRRGSQQGPRRQLAGRERFAEPEGRIQQDKRQQQDKREAPVKAVGTDSSQGTSRQQDKGSRGDCENPRPDQPCLHSIESPRAGPPCKVAFLYPGFGGGTRLQNTPILRDG